MENKQLYTFKITEEFKRLCQPLTNKERKFLEREIMTNGSIYPIRIWNTLLLCDFEIYEIYHQFQIPFDIKRVPGKNKIEVMVWICQEELKRERLTEEMKKYLLGKRYLYEKVLGIHTAASLKLGTKKKGRPSLTPINKYDYSGVKTRERLGEEYHISDATIYKYGFFAQTIDMLFETVPELADAILRGNVKISHEFAVGLQKLPPLKLQEISRVLVDGTKKTHNTVKEILSKMIITNKQPTVAVQTSSIKDMPKYDPDLEFSSLSLTIPSWQSSIERTRNTSNLDEISINARIKLRKALYDLRTEINRMLDVIKEMER